MFEGSCLCGQVQYRLTAEPGEFGYCHCKSCRKASGSAHAANAPVERASFRISAAQLILVVLLSAAIDVDADWAAGDVLALVVDERNGVIRGGADPRGEVTRRMPSYAIGW